MKILVIVVLYAICVAMISGVLMKLARKTGRLTPKLRMGIISVSLLWPVMPELMPFLLLGFLLYKVVQILGIPEPENGESVAVVSRY